MRFPQLYYTPTFNPTVIGERLEKLLVPGPISDNDLNGRIARLEERFRVYAATAPHGLWTPALVITREMRCTTEVYLPLEEISRAFCRLLFLSLKSAPFLSASVMLRAPSWLDVIHHLQPMVREPNPARLLRHLMVDGEFRCRFLFSLFLPRHYGGAFNRYPEQAAFLRDWLGKTGRAGAVRCLDAACGSGEGTYELALLLRECGYAEEQLEVHGATVDPLELFAAAHGWFPHDPARQTAFRRRIGGLLTGSTAERIAFFREDLTENRRYPGEGYDIILCNGFLGGPLLSSREALERTIGRLCARLRPGGLFLAADHFHGGWKKTVPDDGIKEILVRCGLKGVALNGGVAGIQQNEGT